MKTIHKLVEEAGGDSTLADMLVNLGKLKQEIQAYNDVVYMEIPSGGFGLDTFNHVTVQTTQAQLDARLELAGRHMKLVGHLLEKIRARWNRLTLRDEEVLRAVGKAQDKQASKGLTVGLADRPSHVWDMEATGNEMIFGVTRCKKCGILATKSTDLSYCTEG